MKTRQNDRKSVPCFLVDGLEDRRLMSGVYDWVPGLAVWDMDAAAAQTVVMSAVPKASPVAKPTPVVDVTGSWNGTAKIASPSGSAAISMQITSQRGAAASGTFSLGPITSKQTIISTAMVGSDRSFKAMFQGKNFYGSITATITGAKAQEIVGRWTCNTGGKWTTGTFLMDRVVQKARR